MAAGRYSRSGRLTLAGAGSSWPSQRLTKRVSYSAIGFPRRAINTAIGFTRDSSIGRDFTIGAT